MHINVTDSMLVEVNRIFCHEIRRQIGDDLVMSVKMDTIITRHMTKTTAIIVHRDEVSGKDRDCVVYKFLTTDPHFENKDYVDLSNYMKDVAKNYRVPIDQHVRTYPSK